MNINDFKSGYSTLNVTGRYLPYDLLTELMVQFSDLSVVEEGVSVKGQLIRSYAIGKGPIRILMWSQMHGNETTSTKALLDLILFLSNAKESMMLQRLSIVFIPMLNPDGADLYTRVNANGVDLNRDALDQTQPESKILLKVFNRVLPDYCFNLHDQRPVFGAGKGGHPSALSFLAPSGDADKQWSPNRAMARDVLGCVAKSLDFSISESIARFDDAFNLNCFGDYFQSRGAVTMLFEAGHEGTDYSRERIRFFYAYGLYVALEKICGAKHQSEDSKAYSELPENVECYCDILLKNVVTPSGQQLSVGLTYSEKLFDGQIVLTPIISHVNYSKVLFGHRVIDDAIFWNDTLPTPKVGTSIEYLEIKGRNIFHNLTIF